MNRETQACPHCGAALPYTRDAFCIECRNPLDSDPRLDAGMASSVAIEAADTCPPALDDEAPLTGPITEGELRAFVGRNASYYVNKWSPALKTRRPGYDTVTVGGLMVAQPKTGFNWAAFFLAGLWLPYRKLYVPTLLLFGAILTELLIEQVLFVGVLGKPEAPARLGRPFGLAAALVCGWFGNGWYLSRARRVVGEVRSQKLAARAHLRELSKRGGTSLLASFGFFAVFIVAIVALVAASAMFLGAR